VPSDYDDEIYNSLFLKQKDGEEGYRVKPEVMDIIFEHFPEGELIISAENIMSSVLICASDIQFYLESNLEYIDPEKANEFVLKVLTTVLGINRVWKFIEKYYEDPTLTAEYI
jgi:hypothetical protein